jgi:hypothetical protein
MAVILFSFLSNSTHAQSQMTDAERQLFDELNRERAAQNLPALTWDNSLAVAARQHAARMADRNMVSHQVADEPPLAQRAAQAGAHFSKIAENIAVGSDPASIHDGWMSSPGHRRNILDPQLTAVGIAAVKGSGGLFAVQDFSFAVANLSFEQQESQVISLLKEQGMQNVAATDEARKTCKMQHDFAGEGPHYMVRFETPDLSKLPENLVKKILGTPFRRAEVGACSSGAAAGFTQFRIAVLLF